MNNVKKLDQDHTIRSLMEIAAMVRSGDVVGVTVVLTSKEGSVSTVKITSMSEIKTALVA